MSLGSLLQLWQNAHLMGYLDLMRSDALRKVPAVPEEAIPTGAVQ